MRRYGELYKFCRILYVVNSGVHVRSRVASYAHVNWADFKRLLGVLVGGLYVELGDDGGVYILNRGRMFVVCMDSYRDIFGKELYSREIMF